jgi:hydrogenase expression/formation protein HypD
VKYVDEYRDPKIALAVAGEITRKVTRPWVLMEVCGGQTHTLMRYGIDELLPPGIEMVHGPGCPVCVTPLEMVDKAICIASLPGVIFTSYGDMLRVPGSESDLFQAKAKGADVRVVYSPLDALKIARDNPDRKVVFFGVGFETTAPANAHGCLASQARRSSELLHAGFACPGATGDAVDFELPLEPGAGIHRARPRLYGDGLSRV